jgi:BirA family biotin operon repressor/biotin-[acetyl-CoA-carboxylase] ligase
MSSSFDLQRLREEIRPLRLHWFPRLRSTNDHAAALRKRHELFAPAIVLTGHQLAGRGRGSNTWWSGEGSLTVTFVFPADLSLQAHQIPLLAGVAVRSAVAEWCDHANIQLKWPNDLLFETQKLAGLLCERIDKVDLIGLGLNVNVDLSRVPKALRPRVTSMRTITGRLFNMTDVLIDIAHRLHQMLSQRNENSFPTMLNEYNQHHALAGRRVTVTSAGEAPLTGTCTGLDNMGRLLLQNRQKTHRIISGEVRV